jgi:hypothetical protein
MILPSDAGNPSAMIAQSLNIYKHIFKPSSAKGGSPQEEAEETEQPSVTSGMPPLGPQEGHGSTFTLQRGRSPQNWSVKYLKEPFFPSFLFPNDGVR